MDSRIRGNDGSHFLSPIANLNPNPINTLAVSHLKTFSPGPFVPIHRPADAARYATPTFTIVPEQLNRHPSTTICSATEPRSGSTNCGRNARKNSATFGFRMLVTAPWRKTVHSL